MFEMRTLPQHLLARAGETPDRVMQRHKDRGIWREYSFADSSAVALLHGTAETQLALHVRALMLAEEARLLEQEGAAP